MNKLKRTKEVRLLEDIRRFIGLIDINIKVRNEQTNDEFRQLKNKIDLYLHPPKKGYLRFQTSNGFVEFKSTRDK